MSSSPGARIILGTASGVGKSLLTAGLCRLVARAGVRVAPFKPQNMSNNAIACPAGGEIGRAQALQAFACGLDAHPDMNPVLIKPEGDQRAQLIVCGEPRGILRAEAFRRDRDALLPIAVECFERLRAAYDWVWIEGAGSPAEPNLRIGDIANLGFAEAADVDAWLVGDIDRGGVFASLVGTLDILAAEDRARVSGLLINRFRGSASLLDGMPQWLEERTGVPCLGMMPFVRDLCLPEEDAPYRWRSATADGRVEGRVRVGAVVYPTASNLTDLDPLLLEPTLDVRVLDRSEELEELDLVILPGSKAVRRDLAWLLDHGFRPALERHVRYGGQILGICGGLQMLGERIADPGGVEGGGVTDGLGWLPIHTDLVETKRVTEVTGEAAWPEKVAFSGYEIHHGRTTTSGERVPFHAVSTDERIWGTYIHGLFDRGAFRRSVLQAWFGVSPASDGDLEQRWTADLDRLADLLLEHLDLSGLERELGVAL